MIPPEEAWSRIAVRLAPRGSELVPRREALGRRLARPVLATTPVPAGDVSALDGFAFAGDRPDGATLRVAGVVAAGDRPGFLLPDGAAVKIWTGAPVPPGADRVIAIEETTNAGGGQVKLLRVPEAGHAVRRGGEIARVGAVLLLPGDPVGPAALGLLASQGIAAVEVFAPPRVAVLPTGDEVVAADREPAPGQLRDSHSDFLLGALRRLGLAPTLFSVSRDDEAALTGSIAAALESHDVLLVCGGVSRGERDFTEAAFERLGARCEVEAVAIQPGKPFVFAHRDERLLFGLPGNPASVMVAFRLFVEPALRRLEGDEGAAFWSDARPVELANPLGAGKSRDRFVPAKLVARREGSERVETLGVRGSHDLVTFARADRLLRVRAGEGPRDAGASVEAIDWT